MKLLKIKKNNLSLAIPLSVIVILTLLLLVFFENYFNNKNTSYNNDIEKDNTHEKYLLDTNKIILITIESIRWDHLGYMGYPRKTTPFLDELSKKSIVFENMFTSVPMTAPSHASIFTSVYPVHNGVFNNFSFLQERFETMAEHLKSQGFSTAAFTSASTLSGANLEQGFDVYEKVSSPDNNLNFNLILNKQAEHRSAEETIKLAYDWLDKRKKDEKIFIWIHLDDTHRDVFGKSTGLSKLNDNNKEDKNKLIKYWEEDEFINLRKTAERCVFGEECNKGYRDNAFEVIDRYDGAINVLDGQISKLYKYFQDNELGNSVWFILPDHGEGIGTHEYLDHSERIYQEQIRTPLIFHSSEKKHDSRKHELAENVDILPTISEIFSFDIKESIAGRSLVPLLENKDTKERYVFSMTPIDRRYSIQNKEHKYIFWESHGEKCTDSCEEFFNIDIDKYEQKNTADLNQDKKSELKNRIMNIVGK